MATFRGTVFITVILKTVTDYLLQIQVRDLLLWQDVYMGEAGGAGGASQVIKDVISSQNGSQDGSDGGNELAEEMDKLQVGTEYYHFLI